MTQPDRTDKQQRKNNERHPPLALVDKPETCKGGADEADDGEPNQRQVIVGLEEPRTKELWFMVFGVEKIITL